MCGRKLGYASTRPSDHSVQDIYRGKYDGQDVCIKVLRIFHAEEQEKKRAIKVTIYGNLCVTTLTEETGLHR
jgi:hypothetical protein